MRVAGPGFRCGQSAHNHGAAALLATVIDYHQSGRYGSLRDATSSTDDRCVVSGLDSQVGQKAWLVTNTAPARSVAGG